jgi:putative ABC transport system permease protein
MTVIAGRDFTPDEYVDYEAAEKQQAHVPSIILTRKLAEHLFPNESALGKKVYILSKDPQIVVGVIEQIARPNEGNGVEYADYSVVVPVDYPYGNYLVRVDPAHRDDVLAAIEPALMKVSPARIVLKVRPFGEVRGNFFKQDRSMAYLLVGVCIALLIITALGVVGLASFWVQQRTRQIGIRRALGATRRDIRHYFQMENFLLATAGIAIGMALAYAINLWLMHAYAVPRLPGQFLPVGALLLWVLGQLAVLGPAMRASNIAPAIATRSV